MRRVLFAGALAALVGVSAAASSARPRVWITGIRGERDPSSQLELRGLAGGISSRRAGELVTILEKECGAPGGFHRAGSARTRADGSWFFHGVGGGGSTLYRARWRRAHSRPFTLRFPLFPSYEAGASPNTLVVTVETMGQSLAGRAVELQRKVSGAAGSRWMRVRTSRFRRDGLATHFEATFRLPLVGGTLRVFVPRRTARPCYLASSTRPFQGPSARPQVTIRAAHGGPNGPRQVVLSGTIASGDAGQPILVSIKGCGPANRSWRPLISFETGESTRTTAGGAWRWVYPDPRLDEPLYFRAAWGLSQSRALLVRVPLHARSRLRGRTLRVVVETEFTGQSLAGRTVELQRRVGGRWARVAATRLRRAGDHAYSATFLARVRGQKLRAFVPAATAAPCYLATATSSVQP